MVLFSNQKSQFGNFLEGLRLEKIDIFLAILLTSGIFYDHLVNFVFSWYIFSSSGIMDQAKSGNPVRPTVTLTNLPVMSDFVQDTFLPVLPTESPLWAVAVHLKEVKFGSLRMFFLDIHVVFIFMLVM
jgi:hypothetical protein